MIPVDQDARDRVRSSLDESLLVEAGAGTGKTTSIVARIANLLASGTATVDDIAVVTFTKDAAAELVSRVREQLEREFATTTDDARRGRLSEALAGLYRARISTLHVFATTILRERPVEAKVDPQMRTIDGVERGQMMDNAYAAWLDTVLSRDDADLRLALNRGIQLPDLRKLCELLDGQRAALPLAASRPAPVDHGAFRAAVAQIADRLAELAPQCHDAEDPGIVLYPGLRDFAKVVADTPNDLALERIVLERCPAIKPGAGRQPSWATKDACRDYKAAVKALQEEVDPFAGTLRANALLALLPLAQRFVEDFTKKRREAGVADFDDLLLWARELLRTDPAARGWLRRRYRHVVIDEFQDTDPLQAEIALLLTSADSDDTWAKLRPTPGSLVVVGDPKQSIYRFRSADIATYDAVRVGPLANQAASLRQNFRSVDGILAFSNRVFERVFGPGEVGKQAPHVALEGTGVAPVGERAPVVMVADPEIGDDDKVNADETRRREAVLIARTLKLAVDVEGWPVRDGGHTRPATWSDVAILAPSVGTALTTLGPELAALDIPYRATAGSGLFLQPEIAELVNILHAVDDPTDAVHVVGALRSDAFGCSADDLVAYAALGARFDPRRIDETGPGAVVEGLRALHGWRRERRGLSLPELVQRIVDGSGLVELALEQEGGAQAAGNILRVVEEARAFAGAGGGLRAFTRWLEERRESDKESTEAVVTDPSDPLVRIMTIHGAKGLEFPIVALAGFDSIGNTAAPEIIARAASNRVELKLNKQFATPDYSTLADDEKALLKLERDRLLYVAITRARDHLVIPRVRPRAKATGLLAQMMPSLPDASTETIRTDVDGVHVLDTALLSAVEVTDATEAPTAPQADEDATSAVVAAEEAWVASRRAARERASRELVQTVASSVQPFDRIRPLAAMVTSTAEGDAETSADISTAPPLEIGTALHRVMDRVALDGSEDPAPLVTAACLEAGIPLATAELTRLVEACLASPVVRRAAASGRARREIPFTITLPDGAGYAAGRADLVFPDGDELVTVDYKTDALPDAASGTLADAVHAHSGQALVYAAAIEQATGRRVREVVFVFPRVGGDGTLVIDDEMRDAAPAALSAGGL